MKLKTLSMLVKLISTGSFSAVAEELGLTQPAVSMQIKSLQEYFETELVVRQDGDIKLTPAGKIVYDQAKRILEHWEQACLEVKQVKGKTYGKLQIGASTIPATYLLPELMAKFSAAFPEIKILIEVGDSKEVVDYLEEQEVDLAIVGFKPRRKNLATTALTDDDLSLILPIEHSLAKQQQISLAELERQRMLIREKGSGTRKAMLAGLGERGITKNDLNIVAQLGSTEAVISAVEAGVGVSFVSELAARKAVDNNRVQQLKVVNMSISRKLYLTYHQERAEEVLIKEFIKILKGVL